MYKPKSIYTKIALETIRHFLQVGNTKKLQIQNIPEELFTIRRGCFVSLHRLNGELRGCIGTIEPSHLNIYQEIIHNAVAASTRDTRFDSVTISELNEIELSVDVLTLPEKINSLDDLDIQIFGIIVSDNKYKRGILLPDIKGIESIDHQIQIAQKKAGLAETPIENLSIYRFTSTRYH
ncbi:MAG: AmmeMemoRadiSam system protein A [Bacteroidales bacterium]|nr:AmmeMemoRadiSam system protein A [Bacteroidales bacterium]